MTHWVTRIRVYYWIGLAMIIGVGFWAAHKADHWIRMESGGSTPDFWNQYQTFMIPGILVGLMAGWVMSWAVRREVSGMLERLMDAFGSLQRGSPQPMRTQAGTKEEKVLAECFNHALSMVQHAQEQQFKNAMTDSLTGLINRAGLKKQLDNEVQEESVALLFIDLDDFGTGYSSLSHLSRFPLDGLKVDVSFVRDIPTSAGACNLARGIIDLAHNLDLDVVCEGVQTPEQAEFLTMAEADLLQGWYFGSAQPLPSSLSAKAAVPTFASGSVEAVQQPA